MAAIVKEKQDVTNLLASVQAENDQIKIKFAKLLDQFQEYVNDNEIRMQDEELKMRQGQDIVLSQLHSTIKELEQLSQGLQQELMQKDELYQLVRADFNRLEAKY
jgi:tRNA/tmRNA/rRNA uracil-C5-methylase (TrmA/RlmC/RlmD family)